MVGSFAVIGVPTTQNRRAHRTSLRHTWMRDVPAGVAAMFIASHEPRWHEEELRYRDIFVVPGNNYTDTNVHIDQKCFEFLRNVLWTVPTVEYLMLADDDAYVNVTQVVSDVRAAPSRTIVYGGFEWFHYRADNGRSAGWGGNLRMALANSPLLHPNKRDGRFSPVRHPERYSKPFPFPKGPLMLFGAAVARALVFSSHGRAVQAQSAKVGGGRKARVNIDVLIGYILSTADGGRGLANLTYVDIGQNRNPRVCAQGFAEFRVGRNLTSAAHSCFRVSHFGRRQLREFATRVQKGAASAKDLAFGAQAHALTTKEAVYNLGMETLHGLRCDLRPLGSLAAHGCREFRKNLRPVSAREFIPYGDTWTYCSHQTDL